MYLSDLSKKRANIIGVATLSIIFIHLRLPDMPTWLENLYNTFGVGVEMFLIMSGIGCYYSAIKNSAGHFYLKRALRLLPSYFVIYFAFYFVWSYYFDAPFSNYFEVYAPLGLLFGGKLSGWFVDIIILFYLLTPLLVKLLQKDEKIYIISIIGIVILSAQLEFYLTGSAYMINNFGIIRLPTYMLGLYLGKQLYEGKDAKFEMTPIMGILCAGLIIAIVANSVLNKLNYGFIMKILHLPFGLLLCFAATKAPKIFTIFAPISLEVYLSFEKLQSVADIFFTSQVVVNIVAFLGSIILSYILYFLFRKILKI